MIVVYCQQRDALTSAEQRMVAAMRDLPGILLVNVAVTTGRRTREVDGLWLSPTGVLVIEVKGTALGGALHVHANGPWSVGDQPADFPSGPNPLLQARTSAQVLRRTLTDRHVDLGFIPAAVAVSGSGLTGEITQLGDMLALRVEDLPALPRHLRPQPLSAANVLAALAALDLAPEDCPQLEELLGEGFLAELVPAPAADSAQTSLPQDEASADSRGAQQSGRRRSREEVAATKLARRDRRVADLEARAITNWRRSHHRRLIGSVLALAVMAVFMPTLPRYCVIMGAALTFGVGAEQLTLRRCTDGPRDRGPSAVAMWLLTLLPVWGIGSALSWMAALPALVPIAWPFVLMLAILLAAGLTCALLSGRNAFVHPPEAVVERLDDSGRPTGAFSLVRPRPAPFRRPRGRQQEPVG